MPLKNHSQSDAEEDLEGIRDVCELGMTQLVRLVSTGRLSAGEVTEACLDRIALRDNTVHAWQHLDADDALGQAKALDDRYASGRRLGSLHGVPIGIKDIISVAGLPCENGTVLDRGKRPVEDATVVAKLRHEGAVILGKTVTTELALYQPGATRNPWDSDKTPGGSSSGSAAAVGARMVPGALGTQTNGSVIRPASFCGIYGYKPSRGRISRHGVLAMAPSMDTVGTFARSLDDLALLSDVITGFDPADPATELLGNSGSAPLSGQVSAQPPKIGFARTPVWGRADDSTRKTFEDFCRACDVVDEIDLPAGFDHALDCHATLLAAEAAHCYDGYYRRGKERLSERLRLLLEKGQSVEDVAYKGCLAMIERLNLELEPLFARYDALCAPSAAGEAPDASSTGDPAFCSMWTLCGLPSINVPLFSGPNGLPVGLQLIGRMGDDGRLFQTAAWLVDRQTGRQEPAPNMS